MAFPNTPTPGQEFISASGQKYIFENGAWRLVVGSTVNEFYRDTNLAALNALTTKSQATLYMANDTRELYVWDGLVFQLASAGSSGAGVNSYDQTAAYSLGDVANYGGVLITPNDTIPANTPFAWGTTGATWRPHNLLSAPTTALVWRGAWNSGTTYNNLDVVGYTNVPRIFQSIGGSLNIDPTTTQTQTWADLSPLGWSEPNGVYVYPTISDLPFPGRFGSIYHLSASGVSYYWSGSAYILTSIGPVFTHNSGTTYYTSQRVIYSGIECDFTGPGVSVTGAFSWDNWRPISVLPANWKEVWTNNTSYVAGDVVVPSNTATTPYLALSNHTSAASGTFSANVLTAGGSDVALWKPLNTEQAVLSMVGSSASFSGRSGFVPTPTTADVKKFLRGDGLWSSVGDPPITTRVTASGAFSWTPNAATKYARLRYQSPGAGGGGVAASSAGNAACATGGSAGAFIEALIVLPTGTYTGTLGTPGAAGAAGANSGTNGGTSTLTGDGVSITLGGGVAGAGGVSTTTSQKFGTAGGGVTASGAKLVILDERPGGESSTAIGYGATISQAYGGRGGDSAMGVGGEGLFVIDGNSAVGRASVGYGSGGGGAASAASGVAQSGAAGRPGIVIIEEYL